MNESLSPCPNCEKGNALGALQCAHCGLVLDEGQKLDWIEVSSKDIGGIPTESLDLSKIRAGTKDLYQFVLRHTESGKLYSFSSPGSYILGRISDGQSVLPDVDFAPIQGFEAGVSRLHAILNITSGGISLSDLGSSNGTLVNGKSLEERSDQTIENGDQIQFGRLKVEAIINQ